MPLSPVNLCPIYRHNLNCTTQFRHFATETRLAVSALGLLVHMHPLPLAPAFARSALPRKRVRCLTHLGSRVCIAARPCQERGHSC